MYVVLGEARQGKDGLLRFWNLNLSDIVTPIRPEILKMYLNIINYDKQETSFLVQGFTSGFSIGYEGQTERSSQSCNIPFTPGVGDETEMWNKIMSEVKEKRVAGPFKSIPFPK